MKHSFSWRPIFVGALVVGTLDILDAIIFFHFRGAQPIKILQSIASGLLGKAAFDGGTGTAALGLALHFIIALGIVLVLYTATLQMPALVNRPFLVGPVYGVIVWLVMNYVVVPLSAANGSHDHLPAVINGLSIHILGIGIPSTLAVRAAQRMRSREA